METVYHASFLTEEGRRLTLHVSYLTPSFVDQRRSWTEITYTGVRGAIPLPFAEPRPFSVKELVRIAPAVDAWSASLLVCDRQAIDPQAAPGLVMWAILNLREDLQRSLAGERSVYASRPDVLTVTSSRPGHVVINSGWQPFAMIAAGEITTGWNVAHRIVDLLPALHPALSDIDAEVARWFGRHRMPRDDHSDFWSEYHYADALQRLLFLASQHGHGACFLFIRPSDLAAATSSGRLAVKYTLSLPPVSDVFLYTVARQVERQANSGYGPLADLRGVALQIPASVARNPIVGSVRADEVDGILSDTLRAIARLSQVDGAVLMTDRLDCVGFGCEIRISDDIAFRVKRATGPACKYMSDVPVERFGTRHRSAFRFCNAFPGSFALIVSQDGEAKLCTKRGEDVVFWAVSPSGLFLE